MKDDSELFHGVLEDGRDFAVDEGQQLIASIEQMDLGAHGREGAGIFTPNHTRTHHGQRARQPVQAQDLVGIVNARVGKAEARRAKWRRPGGEEDLLAAQENLARRATADANRVWIDEGSDAVIPRDRGAVEVRLYTLAFTALDALLVEHEVADGGIAA